MRKQVRIEVSKKAIRVYVGDSAEPKYTVYHYVHSSRDQAIAAALACLRIEIRRILTEGR